MKLHYEGQELIGAPYETVLTFMSSSAKVSGCLPDVLSTDIADGRHFASTVQVGVGPVKGKFTFQVSLEPNPEERAVGVKMHGGGMGSAVDLQARAVLKDGGDHTTALDWTGDAIVNGPVATVGGRILDAQAKRIIQHVFSKVRETLNAEQGAVTGSG